MLFNSDKDLFIDIVRMPEDIAPKVFNSVSTVAQLADSYILIDRKMLRLIFLVDFELGQDREMAFVSLSGCS